MWSRAYVIISLVPRIASGDFAAMAAAISRTPASISVFVSKQRLTRRSAAASTPVTLRPVYASSRAMPSPTSRGSRCSVPTSAVMPMSISRTENTASAEQ